MADKPKRASEYKSEQVELVRATCLYIATKLGELMDEVVVVVELVPSLLIDQGGKLRDIEQGFAAIIAPGLKLAFQDRRRIRIEGKTIFGEKTAREVWVCGSGAFVVLKALALLGRGENRDAYDLYYLVRNFGAGVEDVAASLRPLLGDDEAQKAIQVLRDDSLDSDAVGPRRVAELLQGGPTSSSCSIASYPKPRPAAAPRAMSHPGGGDHGQQ